MSYYEQTPEAIKRKEFFRKLKEARERRERAYKRVSCHHQRLVYAGHYCMDCRVWSEEGYDRTG